MGVYRASDAADGEAGLAAFEVSQWGKNILRSAKASEEHGAKSFRSMPFIAMCTG
jgi:hypothetical protein